MAHVDISSNSRIAKNTLLLFARMIFLMLINLYASRVILQVLGVVDYGVYNVTGSVTAIFAAMNAILSQSSSRFLSFGMGKDDDEGLKRTFGSILFIHVAFALLLFVFGETVGLWFVNTQLQIPPERVTAAFWIYQFSLVSLVISVISIPYNGAIVAHERMSAFAYISLLDGVLKLLIIFSLIIIPFDKLITYGFLLMLVVLFDQCIYWIYSHRHFSETRTFPQYNKKSIHEITAFTGWNALGGVAFITYSYGLNIVLNMFFGPVVNAARGIATQVQSICMQCNNNVQTAVNPNIIRSYAQGDLPTMHRLVEKSMRFSFYLVFMVALPIVIETPYILHLWLGIVPDHTVWFVRLIMVVTLQASLTLSITTCVQASGTVKKYQITISCIKFMILPVAYLLLKMGFTPEWAFVGYIVIDFISFAVGLSIALPLIKMPIAACLHRIFVPIASVIILSPILPALAYLLLERSSFLSVIVVLLLCVVSTSTVVLGVGCTRSERTKILSKGKNIIGRIIKH